MPADVGFLARRHVEPDKCVYSNKDGFSDHFLAALEVPKIESSDG
jgi:hypothetical protein